MQVQALAEPASGILSYPGRWWVLHTRARHEKAVAAELQRRDILHYLPLTRVRRTYGRRAVTIELPLFPGYLFLCGDSAAREVAWHTHRVANVLPVVDQAGLRTQLSHIERVVASGEPAGLYPALREGRLCRVISGSLKGVEGVIVRRRRHCRLYIAVTILGQSAVVEIDSALVEPLD